MTGLTLTKEGSVYVLTMSSESDANTLDAAFVVKCHELLDEVERCVGNTALVVTGSHPKSWNSGIDLEWIVTQPASYYPEFAASMDRFFLRWALLDIPTVGCLTGHTFGAGAILASTLDFRFMREDKGWFCFPAVDLKLTFTPLMHRIVELLPNTYALRHMLLTGRKIGGKEAADLQMVDAAYPKEILFGKAMELARILACKDRKTYSSIKHGMRPQLACLKTE